MNKKQPNFIIILTDDQGYGDLSCMGATDFKTPNLDRLAASGMRFTNWYSNAPVCSASRAAVLTGRYPGRAGIRGNAGAKGLTPKVPTLATALKEKGYTTGLFGKWHLGSIEESRPENNGFDEWFGFLEGCIDYYSHIFYWGQAGGRNPVHTLFENGKKVYEDGRYFTELITERTVQYIRNKAQKEQPFFLYVTYNAPHYPMHAPKEYLDRFPDLPWDRRIMAAMISAMDDGVGAIVNELSRQNILEDTVIIFQSDNGPSRGSRNWLDGTQDPYYGGTTGKLKGHKFSLYEGGIRVPAIISWSGQIPAGVVSDKVGIAMDIFPTFLKAAGGNPDQYDLDGKDIMSMLMDDAPAPHKEIFWQFKKQLAVRRGRWKLVLNGELVEGTLPEDDVHLSDMEVDMCEKNNLKDEYPELTAQLTEAALQWQAQVEEYWKSMTHKK